MKFVWIIDKSGRKKLSIKIKDSFSSHAYIHPLLGIGFLRLMNNGVCAGPASYRLREKAPYRWKQIEWKGISMDALDKYMVIVAITLLAAFSIYYVAQDAATVKEIFTYAVAALAGLATGFSMGVASKQKKGGSNETP